MKIVAGHPLLQTGSKVLASFIQGMPKFPFLLTVQCQWRLIFCPRNAKQLQRSWMGSERLVE